jgi:hypothetical protein
MGGGGGGAGGSPSIPSVSENVSTPASGNGGLGFLSNITGTDAYYGGGGGGSAFYDWGNNPGSIKSIGGSGVGGDGGYIIGDRYDSANWVAGKPGLDNFGGGGGAGPVAYWYFGGPGPGSGGSGTVVIARPTYGQASDLSVHSGGKIIGVENISNINNLSLSSSGNGSASVSIPLSLITNTTSFTKGGSDKYVVEGLGNYSHTLTVNGGTLSLTNSPSNLLTIETLELDGGGLELDINNPQDLVVNNLSTFANSPITNAQTVTVNGVTNLGSSISSLGDQEYKNDVTLWSDTSLLSTTGNVVFGGKVLGYVSTLQFLGDGQYLFQDPSGTNTSGSVTSLAGLPGGFKLSYDPNSRQYGFQSAFTSQGTALIVAGGGAGGVGGGGGGGVLNSTVMLNSNVIYSVKVGLGGLTNNNGQNIGDNGGDSQFGNLIAYGGGGGGSAYSKDWRCCWLSGSDGGSGGGGAFYNWTQGGLGEVVVLADHQSILDQITPHLMKQVTAVLVLFQTLLERLHIMVAVAVAALLIGLTQEQLGA